MALILENVNTNEDRPLSGLVDTYLGESHTGGTV